ncbi:hypothetical protein Mgra_00007061 [Meloidogyne graminicola]|uniref:Uncharacterized protein n=1 Tax=Meloidogyne graminicola TaxID=189291 RepID=A0A8S9ZJM0_9BILA|nr:hypothetical protein Mgra_00007061 [Meloidogyne graminicola]
MKFNKVLLRII